MINFIIAYFATCYVISYVNEKSYKEILITPYTIVMQLIEGKSFKSIFTRSGGQGFTNKPPSRSQYDRQFNSHRKTNIPRQEDPNGLWKSNKKEKTDTQSSIDTLLGDLKGKMGMEQNSNKSPGTTLESEEPKEYKHKSVVNTEKEKKDLEARRSKLRNLSSVLNAKPEEEISPFKEVDDEGLKSRKNKFDHIFGK